MTGDGIQREIIKIDNSSFMVRRVPASRHTAYVSGAGAVDFASHLSITKDKLKRRFKARDGLE